MVQHLTVDDHQFVSKHQLLVAYSALSAPDLVVEVEEHALQSYYKHAHYIDTSDRNLAHFHIPTAVKKCSKMS